MCLCAWLIACVMRTSRINGLTHRVACLPCFQWLAECPVSYHRDACLHVFTCDQNEVSCVSKGQRVTHVPEKTEGLGQSYIQHADALSEQLIQVFSEVLPQNEKRGGYWFLWTEKTKWATQTEGGGQWFYGPQTEINREPSDHGGCINSLMK